MQEELASVGDSPGQQVDLILDEMLWPDQPLGWDIGGTEESVGAITREMILDYAHRQYVPNNMVVSVAGNVQQSEVIELLESSLAAMPRGDFQTWFPASDGQMAPACRMLSKRTEQTHIALGMQALPLGHPDRYALDLLSVLFGESMSSRLFMELRERMGLCYDVNSYVSHFLDTGSFGLYAAVDPTNGPKTVAALMSRAATPRRRYPGRGADQSARAREGASAPAHGGHTLRLRLARRPGDAYRLASAAPKTSLSGWTPSRPVTSFAS